MPVGYLHCLFDYLFEQLHIRGWTPNEKLQNEKTNFSTILKNVRMMEAFHLLEENNHPPQDITDLIGFSSQSAFNRFFKTNTNMTLLGTRLSRP